MPNELLWATTRQGLTPIGLVENEVRILPDDFLAYHQPTLSPYRGMPACRVRDADRRGPVVETDEYPSAEACAKAVLS